MAGPVEESPGRVRVAPSAPPVVVAPLLLAAKEGLSARAEEASRPELSPRATEVLQLVARRLPNKRIARELHISEKTVKAHLTQIFQRIGVTDRTQAALWAKDRGLAS